MIHSANIHDIAAAAVATKELVMPFPQPRYDQVFMMEKIALPCWIAVTRRVE